MPHRSFELVAATVALLTGIGLALGTTRFISNPLLQTLTAAVAGWLLGSLIGAVVWLRHPGPDASVAAVAWSFPEVLIGTAVVALVALAIHAAFGLLNLIHPALGSWRHLLVGVGASLAGLRGYRSG